MTRKNPQPACARVSETSLEADAMVRVQQDMGDYMSGDVLLVRLLNGDTPTSGKKVIACVDGLTVCKVYREGESGAHLEPLPGADDAACVPVRAGVSIVAIVVGVYRKE